MANVLTSTSTTNYDKSIPEEVDKVIVNVAPTDTPFISSIGSGKAKTLNPSWMEDTLEAAGSNAHKEGADTEAAAITPPGKLDNYVQRLEKALLISEDLEATDKHGRSSELKYQSGLKTKEIARDLEWSALNNTKVVPPSADTAGEMDGAFAFVGTGNDYDFAATPASTNHITEDILNDILQAMWEQGANPDTVLAPPAQKRKISDFTAGGRLTFNTSASQKKITMMVRIIETDFGTVAVIPERHIEPIDDAGTLYDKVLCYEKSKFKVLTFRALKREKLAKTGDAIKYRLTMSKTLKCLSKKCVGAITNLTRVKAA